MPTTAQQFFLGTVNDDQAFGSVVKKIQEAAPANDTSTSVTWTNTTVTEKTIVPQAGNSANGDTSNNNGWALNHGGADGMGSAAGAVRRIRAGVWSFTVQITLNTAALLDTHALTLKANVYRVAAGGGSRSLLFQATSANQTDSATVTWSSAAQPEIIIQPGETIMVGYAATSASTTATLFGANTNTVMTVPLGANCRFTVPAPGIETLAITHGASAAASTVSGALATTGAMVGGSAGSATAAGALGAVSETVGTAAGLANVTPVLAGINTSIGAATAASSAAGGFATIGAMVGNAGGLAAVNGLIARVLATLGVSDGAADVEGALAAVGATVGHSNAAAFAIGSFGAVSETTGNASAASTVTGSFALVAPTVGTVNVSDGGGDEIIVINRKQLLIVDEG